MKPDILQTIDFAKVDTLLEGFNKSTGFVTAILDLEGKVLSKSGWRQLCTEFHRINPETSKKCTISDTELANKMGEGEKYHFYKCLNGLVDVAVPIVINGEHVANLFSGQFFFEEPDSTFFKKQAEKYGFDEERYMVALKNVPVVSQEKVKTAMEFLLSVTQLICEMTFQKLVQTESNKTIKESEEMMRNSQSVAHICSYSTNLIVDDIAKSAWVCSPEFYRIFGIDKSYPHTIEGWAAFIHPDYRQEMVAYHEYVIKEKIRFEHEYKIIRINDGVERWVYGTGKLEFDEIGNPIRMHGAIQDITEQKQAENAIRKLNAELEMRVQERTALLEASNKELEAFSYSVSHDLRTPLRHINGYIGLLNQGYSEDLPEKAHHYLDTILEASRKMGTLIDDLLQYSRAGRQEVRKTQVDMNLLVKEVTDQLKTGLENREILWDIQKLPTISGDYVLLKQVWVNLIENAIKYTRKQQTAKISVSSSEETQGFVFCVSDNGVGFDMKYAHKLFGVFQRLHSLTEFEGTGIGLANVQRIVHKHLGRVWAEAELGKGAKFYFSLPNYQEEKS